MKLRSYLTVLVLAGALPLVVLTGVVAVSLVRQQRAAVDAGLSDTVEALAAVLDNELDGTIKSLQTLATSQRLDDGNLPAFYEYAQRVRDLHHWTTIGLIDAAGSHLLNVARPLGAPLPDLRDRDYFRQVVATGAPYVSDLLRGRATSTVDVAVAVPVMRDGRLRYVLFAGVSPGGFSAMFDQQRLPPGAIVSIISRDGLIIARTRDHGQAVGQAVSPAYLAQIRATPQGRAQRMSREGIDFESAFKRLSSGWTVDFGVPAETVSAPVRRIAWAAAATGTAIVAATLGLAAFLAHRMARDIRDLAAVAAGLGRGESPPARPLAVAELDDMWRSLAAADEVLRQRERERAELLASERAARAEAEAASRAKDDFLAMLGHELRNPLGAIAGAVGVVDRLARGDERIARATAVIGRQVQHLSRLVDDLLDVTRVMHGKVYLDRRPLDLGELVQNLATAWRASGRFDRHEVEVHTEPAWIDADETRMEQVVGNLVGNALKYTPAGGQVRVRVRAHAECAVLEVTDTGVGIPPRLLPAVFDLFVQGDRALDRTQGGLGLGLTLVKALVGLHGGSVQATSDGPGRGTTFTARLPLIPPPAPAEPRADASAMPGSRRRILLVEDNQDSREMVRLALSLAGHEVHEAPDGPTAVELARTIAPDIAVVDIGLPGIDGYEVARRIRAMPGGKAVRLVALTGYGQAADRLRALEAGFDAHLTKPVTPERLAELTS
jgi:signal transduction histidine kinase